MMINTPIDVVVTPVLRVPCTTRKTNTIGMYLAFLESWNNMATSQYISWIDEAESVVTCHWWKVNKI